MAFLLAAVSGLAFGILTRSLFIFGWEPLVFALVLATLFIGAFVWRPRRSYLLAAVFLLLAGVGMLRMSIAETPLPTPFAWHVGHRVGYDGVVVGDPDLRDTTARTTVRIESGRASTLALVVAPRTEHVSVGERVHVSGTLEIPQPFLGDNGRVFAYDQYLARGGVRFILNYASMRVLAPAPWYSISATLAHLKHAFITGLSATLPEPYSSLASGIVIGGKSGLGTTLENAFTKSGLVQIIVLSGYNIMVVAEWIMAALAYTSLSRGWRALGGGLAVILFVGIAGASATALRAALMAFIALYARATGKSYSAGRALLAVVFVMLVWNPFYLAFDPGFALSVAATAGLIWLAPIIENTLRGKTEPTHRFFQNAFATTLAAQIAVLPLLLYFTGNLSFVAIPANLIVDPFVPLAMGFAAIAGVAGMLFGHVAPLLGIVLGYPAYLATSFMIFVATYAASLPDAAITLIRFPWWLMLVLYLLLAAFVSWRSRRVPLRALGFGRTS